MATLELESKSVILLDVEGTVAPISFVYEVLFPYARAYVEKYISSNWSDPRVQGDVESLRLQSIQDRAEGLGEVPVVTPPDGHISEIQRSVVENVLWQMDEDRKTTALKALQGKIWHGGFTTGELKSVVFSDVEEAMQRWKRADKDIAIYSSGSVAAQKLFFTHTEIGDFTPYLTAYFDTETGPKREPASYTSISRQLGVSPESVLFLTDVVAEAQAAESAGCVPVIVDRPGNQPQPDHHFLVLQDFHSL